jgi:hypothetical protein
MPRTYKPRIPAGEPRPKSGGRKKGSLNKSTVAIREAVLSVFADMQATTGRENGHFLDWALGNATAFYKLTSKLLPMQATGENRGPVITHIELVAPTAEDIALAREGGL